jgi:hypothetical protein
VHWGRITAAQCVLAQPPLAANLPKEWTAGWQSAQQLKTSHVCPCPAKAREWQKCHSLLVASAVATQQASATVNHRDQRARARARGWAPARQSQKTLSEFVEEVCCRDTA